MKRWLLKMLKPFIREQIKKLLSNKEFEEKLVKKINEHIDIPKVDEESEAKLFSQIYVSIKDMSLEIIDKL